MNVIFFVIVILMLLTTLTYGRFQLFLNQTFIQSRWVKYMETAERCEYNNAVYNLYTETPASPHKSKISFSNKVQTSSKINFMWIINPEKIRKNPEISDLVKALTTQLIKNLYENERFFQEALATQPDLIEILYSKLTYAFENRPEKLKLQKPQDLISLPIDNSDLERIFGIFLQQSPKTDDTNSVENQCPTISLSDFLTLRSKIEKINVYLARKELLLAIYENNETLVSDILKKRTSLYREVTKKPPYAKTLDEASQEFKEEFGHPRFSEYAPILDFKVTKTRPP